MTTVLRALQARFARDGVELVAPFTLRLRGGETGALHEPSARAASIAARMCAAIVKPTDGTIFIGEFETRLQPPQAKRLVGFVDAAGFAGDRHAFKCEVCLRAEVWGLSEAAALARAREVLAVLGDAPYARAIALALVADVALVVLDQPAPRYADGVREVAAAIALLCTQVAVCVPAVPEASLTPALP